MLEKGENMGTKAWANVVELKDAIDAKIASGEGIDGATMARAQNQIMLSMVGALAASEAVERALRESLQAVLLAIKNTDAEGLTLAIEEAEHRVSAAMQAREEYAKRELGIGR